MNEWRLKGMVHILLNLGEEVLKVLPADGIGM